MISRNDPCWCGSKIKWKKCHYPELPNDDLDLLSDRYKKQYGIILKTKEQITGIKRACLLASEILQAACRFAKKGVTTNAIDRLVKKMHDEAGAIPAPLHYGSPPFPKSLCTSLNDQVCHGIPDDRPLRDGDILNIDITSILDGYYGDCSTTISIGKIDKDKQIVMEASHSSLTEATSILKPGILICEIGNVIENKATSFGCSVVRKFVGHGVGLQFHENPQIPHFKNECRIPLVAGMTFTVEPMINFGSPECYIDSNRWTAYTTDGHPSAQYEDTVLITKDSHEILTKRPANINK